MSSGQVAVYGEHPLVSLLSELKSLRERYAEAPGLAWTLTPSQLTELVPGHAELSNWLAAAGLAMLREADRHQVGDPIGAANTAAWFARVSRTTKPGAHRAVALAKQLDDDAHATLRDAALSGSVSVEQARVIVDAVEKLPADLVDPSLKKRAETDLVDLAADHGPRELRFLGRRILEYIAPDAAEGRQSVGSWKPRSAAPPPRRSSRCIPTATGRCSVGSRSRCSPERCWRST